MLRQARQTLDNPVVLALLVGIVAAALRLFDLTWTPPGFSASEARIALAARSFGDGGSAWLPERGTDPAFLWLMQPFGELLDWSVVAPRATAASLGILAVVACALWFRRVLGPPWGLLGGFLAATWFPLLLLSRVGLPEVGAVAMSTTGFWCLWEARDAEPPGRGWAIASGAAFGLGAWFSIAGFLLLPAVLVIIVVALMSDPPVREATERGALAWPSVHPGVLAVGALLVVATPLVVHALVEPDELRARIERDWDGDGQVEPLRDPAGIVSGVGETLWGGAVEGYDSPLVNLPGRPLLDGILPLWLILGIMTIVRSPRSPLHGAVLVWLIACVIPPALVMPGHPGLLLPASPALLIVPLLGVRTVVDLVRDREPGIRWGITSIAIASIVVSMGWSLWDYWGNWANSDEVDQAFDGDLRVALEAAEALPRDAGTIYLSTWGHDDQVRYLAPGRAHEIVDGRTTLVVPATETGYLVIPTSTPLDPWLRSIVEQGTLLERRARPDGSTAAEVWRLDPQTRDALPATVPTIRFAGEINLVGFDVGPDLGDVATTGRLPDPPRLVVTLIWSVARGGPERIGQIRLIPTDPLSANDIRTTSITLDPGERHPGNGDRELIVTRSSVVVPETPDRIVDVQAGLLTEEFALLPPVSPPSAIVGGYALLGRVQYVEPEP